jgi:GNAT superfamily N-acetyltransferase
MEITTVDVLDDALQLELSAVLSDCVKSGASVGFVVPVADGELESYWRGTAEAVKAGTQVLLIAREGKKLVGTVQLALAQKANARHRAEVQRLLVPPALRRKGIGRQLMKAVEAEALRRARTLLVWDTIVGDTGDHLYTKMGYTRAGVIPDYALSADGAKLEPTVYFYALLGDDELTLPAPQVAAASPVSAPKQVAARPVAGSDAAFVFDGSIERYGRSEPLHVVIDAPVPGDGDTHVCVVHAPTLGLKAMRVLGTDARHAAELALDLVRESTDGNTVLTDGGEPVDLATWTVRS